MYNDAMPIRMPPDIRQKQIIQVAALHFARDGYDGASMSAIAVAAGVTRPLVYHYFPGKLALLEAVLQHEAEALLAATSPDPCRSPEENLRAALMTYLDHFSPNSGGVLNLTLNSNGAQLPRQKFAQSNHAVQASRIIALLALADLPIVHTTLEAWFEFVTVLARNGGGTNDARDFTIDLCMNTLSAIVQALKTVPGATDCESPQKAAPSPPKFRKAKK